MNSPFIGVGIFSFLFMFGLSFVIDALRRKPRKAKKEFNWGKLDELPTGSIFDDLPDENERVTLKGKNYKGK